LKIVELSLECLSGTRASPEFDRVVTAVAIGPDGNVAVRQTPTAFHLLTHRMFTNERVNAGNNSFHRILAG
jgi:hypothetical protein